MQSKRSCFNKTLFCKNLSRFWPLWVLSSVVGAMFPLVMLMNILRYGGSDYYKQGAVSYSAMYYEVVSYGLPIISLFYAIVVALAVWHYLYNHRSVSMMHTLPLRREGLFVTNFLSGMAMLLIPYAVTGILTIGISLAFGWFDPVSVLVTIAAVAGESFFYFASATFAAFIVGNVFALPAMYFVLHFLAVTVDYLVSMFSQGFLFGLTGTYSGAAEYLSPTVYLMQHVSANRTYQEVKTWSESLHEYYDDRVLSAVTLENGWLILVYTLVGVVLLGFAWMLYQRRRSETAGDVVSVGWMRPVFRYGVAACGALGGGLLLYQIFWDQFQEGRYYGVVPMVIFMVWAGLVGYFAAAMLLAKSFRVFRSDWRGAVLVLAGCVALCTALEFDLFRITQRVPAIDEVEEVSFSVDGNTYRFYPGEEDELLQQVRLLHKTILAEEDYQRQADLERNYEPTPADEGRDFTQENIRFIYNLKNGQSIQRRYWVFLTPERIHEPGTTDYALDKLVNSAEMKRKRLHIGDSRYTVRNGSLYLETQRQGHDFSTREMEAIFRALALDAQAGTWGTVDWFNYTSANEIAGSMDISFRYQPDPADPEYYEYDWINITLRPDMTNTLNCLKALGYATDADLITRAELYPEDYEDELQYLYDKYGVDFMNPSSSVGIIGGAETTTAIVVRN